MLLKSVKLSAIVMAIGALTTTSVIAQTITEPHQIKFQGEVQSNTCTFEANNASNTVTLPTVYVNEFSNNNNELKKTPFTITLKNCTVDKRSATIVFKDLDATTHGVTLTTGQGNGVNIVLLSDDSRILQRNTRAALTKDSITQFSKSFFAAYKKDGKTIVAGRLEGIANVDVIYQ